MVKLLLSEGANSIARDKNGWTSLHLAILNQHLELALLLVENVTITQKFTFNF
jgi:ankyrin repeat protein